MLCCLSSRACVGKWFLLACVPILESWCGGELLGTGCAVSVSRGAHGSLGVPDGDLAELSRKQPSQMSLLNPSKASVTIKMEGGSFSCFHEWQTAASAQGNGRDGMPGTGGLPFPPLQVKTGGHWEKEEFMPSCSKGAGLSLSKARYSFVLGLTQSVKSGQSTQGLSCRCP